MAQVKVTVRRADAQRNRERILEAAAEAFARDGNASLSAIGKLAGVGQGTLYRHFPDRDALIWAVHDRDVHDLVSLAEQMLADLPPRQALRGWMSHLARFAITKSGLRAALNWSISSEKKTARPGYAQVVEAVEALLAANRAAGSVRRDVTAGDFTTLVAGLWQIRPGDEGEARAERLLDLILIALSAEVEPALVAERAQGG